MLNKLGPIAKKKENIMSHADFCQIMRMANEKQQELLLHTIHHLLSDDENPLQIFFTGPAGCGKTFVIKLIMEIYNRFSDTDGYCNAYIACASTGKAAVAIGGTTVHTALKISLSKLLPLSIEIAHQYRALLKFVKVLIIDEVSMIGAELLEQIDSRLKQITGRFNINFGGLDIIFIGDLRQLPPVRATHIYKQIKRRMTGPTLWRGLKFFELTEVVRQSNVMFATALTKIGDGVKLTNDELQLIESRFMTKEEAARLCPNGVRLFFSNEAVKKYNDSILNNSENKIVSLASDVYVGCHNAEQESFVRQKLHKMSTIDTGGLPYELIFVPDQPYMITTNIDVSDGLSNGTVGKLCQVDRNENGDITKIWMLFPKKVGQKINNKWKGYIRQKNINPSAVPITAHTSSIPLNNNKTIVAKRKHFPLLPACAITIHKSQGGTFDEIVYEYDKSHSLELVYVALSRVTNIEGLYIVTKDNNTIFFHGRRNSTSVHNLQDEFKRLALNPLQTVTKTFIDFISNRRGLSIFSLNCQSLRAHAADLNDTVLQRSNVLIFTETHMTNEQPINIPNFNCIISYKRPQVPAAGVAIYHNVQDTTHIVSSHMDIHVKNTPAFGFNVSEIGEICIAHCNSDNGQKILMVAVYISPNKSIQDIIEFLHTHLLIYTTQGSRLLNKAFNEVPMILSGDFNTNFSENSSQQLIDFLNNELSLSMSNDRKVSTTRYGTTIDAVFTRYLHRFQSKIFISYFSYHKPIVSFLDYNNDDTNNVNIVEIHDNENNIDNQINVNDVYSVDNEL